MTRRGARQRRAPRRCPTARAGLDRGASPSSSLLSAARHARALGASTIPDAWSFRSRTGSAAFMTWLKVELHLADARLIDRDPRRAAAIRLRRCWPRASSRHRREAVMLPRLSWIGVVRRRWRSPAMRSAGCGWRCCAGWLLPLHRAVRPVGQRHADAGADRHLRAALRRHRAAARHLGLSLAARRQAASSRRRST